MLHCFLPFFIQSVSQDPAVLRINILNTAKILTQMEESSQLLHWFLPFPSGFLNSYVVAPKLGNVWELTDVQCEWVSCGHKDSVSWDKKVIAAKPVPFPLQTVLCMALVGLQHLPALWPTVLWSHRAGSAQKQTCFSAACFLPVRGDSDGRHLTLTMLWRQVPSALPVDTHLFTYNFVASQKMMCSIRVSFNWASTHLQDEKVKIYYYWT